MREGFGLAGSAARGEDAVARVPEVRPSVILMDINLAGEMDGIEAARRIQALRDVPVLYLTGFDDEATVARAGRTAPFAYLLKPFTRKELAVTIRMALYKHQTEQKLRTMAAALEGIADAVLITETDWTGQGPPVVYANDGFEKMTGFPKKQALRRPLMDALTGNANHEAWLNEVKKELAAKSRFRGEWAGFLRNGREALTQWDIAPVPQTGSQSGNLVFIIRDLTHVRRLEENVRQTQKIEAVGRLASGVAHDFNNLLSVINTYSDLLSLKLPPDHPNHKYAGQIRAAGRKGGELVSRLMTFSRRDKPALARLDLPELTENIKDMLRRVLLENIRLESRHSAGVKPVRADRGQVEQALLNLCVNARDAMPEGGRILIETNNRTLEPDEGPMPPGDYVVLSVQDTGCGMDENTRKHIFEPFFTTKESGRGTGLGLSTVYGSMQRLGGTVEVRSVPGRGSTFELIFPAAAGEDAPGVKQRNRTARAEPAPVYLALADELWRETLAGLLRHQGLSVNILPPGGKGDTGALSPEGLLVTDEEPDRNGEFPFIQAFLKQHDRAQALCLCETENPPGFPAPLKARCQGLSRDAPLTALLTRVREMAGGPKE